MNTRLNDDDVFIGSVHHLGFRWRQILHPLALHLGCTELHEVAVAVSTLLTQHILCDECSELLSQCGNTGILNSRSLGFLDGLSWIGIVGKLAS